MSKAVMLSIKPKWCALIASGKKTIEVRKTAPRIETPFKCYIYCTKGGRPLVFGDVFRGDWDMDYVQTYGWSREEADRMWGVMNGKVIGEFICDELVHYAKYGYAKQTPYYMKSSVGGYPATEIHYASLQLSPTELDEYGKGKPLFGWNISDLIIYDEPKPLTDFYRPPCERMSDCGCCPKWDIKNRDCIRPPRMMRAPQSWRYVEGLA